MPDVQRNIAYGYLSVFLGFLCLRPDINGCIRAGWPSRSLRPLVASIEEFVSYHEKADELWEDDMGHNPTAGLTQRLQHMVGRLKKL